MIPNSYNTLIAKTIPPFPAPSSAVADELSKVCPANTCKALFDWIGKLKVLEEQLELYEQFDDEQESD